MKLTKTEEKIYEIFIQEYRRFTVVEMYKRKEFIFFDQIKLDINTKNIPFDIFFNLSKNFVFLNNDDISNTLLYTSILYAKMFKKNDLINYIKTEKNSFYNFENEWYFFTKVIEYALKFIIMKFQNKILKNDYKNLINDTQNIINKINTPTTIAKQDKDTIKKLIHYPLYELK